MGLFIDQYNLAKDQVFLIRVEMAAVQAAINIYNENPNSSPNHAARVRYATKVLTTPSASAAQLAEGVTATNLSMTTSVSDTDLATAVASIWDAYAA